MDTELTWRKASKSGNGGECVEIGTRDGQVAGIRDSKSPERGHLAVTPARFAEFLASVKDLEAVPGRMEVLHTLQQVGQRGAYLR
jgi:Domain of unknown function (DUF397)